MAARPGEVAQRVLQAAVSCAEGEVSNRSLSCVSKGSDSSWRSSDGERTFVQSEGRDGPRSSDVERVVRPSCE